MLGRFHQRYGHRLLSSVAVPTPKSDLCTDNMKYNLLNAVSSCRYTDRETYTEQRQALFMDMPSILTDNRGSPQKAENLYVVLYAQFFTMRICRILAKREALNKEWLEDNLQDDASMTNWKKS